MSAPAKVTREHLERAYAQTRKPGWPTLDELREHYLHYSAIRGRAQGIANGQVMPPAPIPVAVPAVQARPPMPAPPQRRRQSDGAPGIDHKLAASGEYTHREDE